MSLVQLIRSALPDFWLVHSHKPANRVLASPTSHVDLQQMGCESITQQWVAGEQILTGTPDQCMMLSSAAALPAFESKSVALSDLLNSAARLPNTVQFTADYGILLDPKHTSSTVFGMRGDRVDDQRHHRD